MSAPVQPVVSVRTYDHNGHKNLPIACPQWDDVEVAARVRMLMRNDLDHEMICTVARDRILCLAKENAALAARVAELEAFAVDVRDNWDCDAHDRKHAPCRCCKADSVLSSSR